MRFFRLSIAFLFLVSLALAHVEPVTFRFQIAAGQPAASPFQDEIDADVACPSGNTVRVPAFYRGDSMYEVRLFPGEKGQYILRAVHRSGAAEKVDFQVDGTGAVEIVHPLQDSFVRIDPDHRLRFIRGGRPYVPLGANLPWAPGQAAEYYTRTFAAFGRADLSWSRIWMAHWASMNLDWLPSSAGKSPAPGDIDLTIADTWDTIVRAAEDNRVAFQLVLQHHGQIAQTVNPNWKDNPWNSANGGFLSEPEEFFTSETARRFTRLKYRYIVARWGYSPSIMAWELFNELHNTEPFRARPLDDAAAAAWHREMAGYLRSIDVHHHLITTSHDELESAVYSEMDYLQPHLYSPQMVLASPHVPLRLQDRTKPVFFGEIGDDQVEASPEAKKRGDTLLPPVWASLMGDADQPGQTWYVERLVAAGRLDELGAVARFIGASGIGSELGLTSFSPATTCAVQVPLRIPGTLWWHRHEPIELDVATDGSIPRDIAFFPKAVAYRETPAEREFPSFTSVRIHLKEPTVARLILGPANTPGASFKVVVNGATVWRHAWPASTDPTAPNDWKKVLTRSLNLPAGESLIQIRNTHGPDWFHIEEVTFDVPTSALAAIAKKNENFIAAWIWRRDPLTRDETVAGRVDLGSVRAGLWQMVWWDTREGKALFEKRVRHRGGSLVIDTPPVAENIACYLRRTGE